MTEYAHTVDFRMACGCRAKYKMAVEGEPSSESIYDALMGVLQSDEVMTMLVTDDHTQKGNEKIDIEVRTKVV